METTDSEPQWFCIRSKPRRQNVAAVHLRTLGFEVFNPLLRRRRATRRGAILSTLPLFPNYLFARFAVADRYRAARYAFGVSDILRFGDRWVSVPDAEIKNLQSIWNQREAVEPEERLAVGAAVVLVGGLFHGVEATVVELLPARQRVKILLDFLGGMKEAEVDSVAVLPELAHPLAA